MILMMASHCLKKKITLENLTFIPKIVFSLKSATKPLNVLIAFSRPLITEFEQSRLEIASLPFVHYKHLELFQPTKCPLRLKELPDCKKAPDTSVSGAIIGY